MSILLVDDRPEDLLVLQTVLASPRHELIAVTSGFEALRRLLERDYAVIVLDVVMPIMDGFELASMIRGRSRSSQTPILFLTGGSADVGSLYRAYAVGGVDYLTKPVDPDILRAKVGVFVNLFEKDRRLSEQSRALLAAEVRNKELELAQVRLAGARRYRNLADAMPQIVWTADPSGKVTYLNRRWAQYTGLTSEEAPAGSWLDVVHPEERADSERRWRYALEHGEAFELECRLRAADGSYRWHLCRAAPEKGVDEEILGWLGTHVDLDDMFRAHRKAERAIRVRDEFLSVASHELRTPLSALLVQLGSLEHTITENLGDRDPREDRALRKVGAALRHTQRLTKLVDNLLDISRLSAKRLHLDLEEYDLSHAIRELVERFAEEAKLVGCPLEVQAPTSLVGTWDRLRIEQVVTNLLSNAIKYGRGQPVEVGVEGNPMKARVWIRDHGIGISAQDSVRIFDRFERAVPVQHYGGLGLGLYIARKIVEAHGGTIELVSEPGRGATFTVELPRGLTATAAKTASRATS